MILRRITEHVKAQNWFAVDIDFVVPTKCLRRTQFMAMNTARIENPYAEIFRDIDTVVEEMPVLVPPFEYLFEAYGLDETVSLETMAHLLRAVRNRREDLNAQVDASP